MTETSFQKGERVRIKEWVDPQIYNNALTLGNEAIIKDISKDRWGFQMVYVEWDKNHWTYNGAPDKWTYADHFEKVKTEMPEINQTLIEEITKQVVTALTAQNQISDVQSDINDDEVMGEAEDILNKDQINELEEKRQSAIDIVLDKISESDAFIVIGVDHVEHEESIHGAFSPYFLRFALTPESNLVADAFLSSVGAEAHMELVTETIINNIRDNDNGTN